MLQTDRVENDKLSWEHKEFLFHTTVIFVSIVVQYEGISPCLDNYVLLSTLVYVLCITGPPVKKLSTIIEWIVGIKLSKDMYSMNPAEG